MVPLYVWADNTGNDRNNVFINSILATHVGRFQDPLESRDPQFEKLCSISYSSGVSLVWKLGVVGPAVKTGGLLVLKVQQTEARSTGLRVPSPEFLFDLGLHKSFYFQKVKLFSSHILVQFRI